MKFDYTLARDIRELQLGRVLHFAGDDYTLARDIRELQHHVADGR